jgi:hypothetical protein
MSSDDLGLDAKLGDHLVTLLGSHGVQANHRDGVVYVGTGDARWVRLSATRETNRSVIRLDVDAAGPDGSRVVDSLNGLADDPAAAANDAVLQFCVCDFHVLLAGLWGLLEEDQVDHYTVTTDVGPWDLYVGAWVSRMSAPANAMPAPEAAFVAALMAAAPALLRERRSHAGRVFVAAVAGALTYEALVDMQPSGELEAVLRSLPLAPPPSGYASQRLFFLALPRQGRSAHVRTGRCTPAGAADVAPAPGRGRLWIGLTLAMAVIATVYFALR